MSDTVSTARVVTGINVVAMQLDGEDPLTTVQYAVVNQQGQYLAYGDQSWVASGKALEDHPGCRIARRTIKLAYGDWEDVGDGEDYTSVVRSIVLIAPETAPSTPTPPDPLPPVAQPTSEAQGGVQGAGRPFLTARLTDWANLTAADVERISHEALKIEGRHRELLNGLVARHIVPEYDISAERTALDEIDNLRSSHAAVLSALGLPDGADPVEAIERLKAEREEHRRAAWANAESLAKTGIALNAAEAERDAANETARLAEQARDALRAEVERAIDHLDDAAQKCNVMEFSTSDTPPHPPPRQTEAAMGVGIRVTAEDLESGETGTRVIEPGDYCLVAAEPLYLAGEQRHLNGTVVLTLKRRGSNEEGTNG